MTLEDKIAELGEQTDLPYGLVEALLLLLASRTARRCQGQTFNEFILSTPIEKFLAVLEPLAWELQKANLLN